MAALVLRQAVEAEGLERPEIQTALVKVATVRHLL